MNMLLPKTNLKRLENLFMAKRYVITGRKQTLCAWNARLQYMINFSPYKSFPNEEVQ